MTVPMNKGLMNKCLAVGGLCALLATAAAAQDDGGSPMHHGGHARQAIMRQKATYARAIASGHYGAAERAHLRAKAIRHHVRARRAMRMDGGY